MASKDRSCAPSPTFVFERKARRRFETSTLVHKDFIKAMSGAGRLRIARCCSKQLPAGGLRDRSPYQFTPWATLQETDKPMHPHEAWLVSISRSPATPNTHQ